MKSFPGIIIICLGIISLSGCEKDETQPPATGTMTDIDGNVYNTIKIGNQWWMTENLKVKTYRNGLPIRKAQSDAEWADSVSAFCVYRDDATAPGLLYNWYAVSNTNQIAPAGWHIPSDDEWKELEKFLGMSQAEADKQSWRGAHEGEKLKISGMQGWKAYTDVWPTNESGFTALAGSCRLYDGVWGDPGLFNTGFWWTSSNFSENTAWYRYLDYKNANVFRSKTNMMYGFSIRCVKN